MIGIFSGVSVAAFNLSIEALREFFYYNNVSTDSEFVLLIPALGGVADDGGWDAAITRTTTDGNGREGAP